MQLLAGGIAQGHFQCAQAPHPFGGRHVGEILGFAQHAPAGVAVGCGPYRLGAGRPLGQHHVGRFDEGNGRVDLGGRLFQGSSLIDGGGADAQQQIAIAQQPGKGTEQFPRGNLGVDLRQHEVTDVEIDGLGRLSNPIRAEDKTPVRTLG